MEKIFETCVNKHVLMSAYKKTTSKHMLSCTFPINFSAHFYPHNGKGAIDR